VKSEIVKKPQIITFACFASLWFRSFLRREVDW